MKSLQNYRVLVIRKLSFSDFFKKIADKYICMIIIQKMKNKFLLLKSGYHPNFFIESSPSGPLASMKNSASYSHQGKSKDFFSNGKCSKIAIFVFFYSFFINSDASFLKRLIILYFFLQILVPHKILIQKHVPIVYTSDI